MELLYVWIEDYKNIKKQGFNFSPKHRFEFTPEYKDEKDKNKITGGELTHKITKKESNLFGKDILNITGVVGKNGAGKTNLLKFLLYESINNNPHFIIFENNGKLLVFCNMLSISNRKYLTEKLTHSKIQFYDINFIKFLYDDTESIKTNIIFYSNVIYPEIRLLSKLTDESFYLTDISLTRLLSYKLTHDNYKTSLSEFMYDELKGFNQLVQFIDKSKIEKDAKQILGFQEQSGLRTIQIISGNYILENRLDDILNFKHFYDQLKYDPDVIKENCFILLFVKLFINVLEDKKEDEIKRKNKLTNEIKNSENELKTFTKAKILENTENTKKYEKLKGVVEDDSQLKSLIFSIDLYIEKLKFSTELYEVLSNLTYENIENRLSDNSITELSLLTYISDKYKKDKFIEFIKYLCNNITEIDLKYNNFKIDIQLNEFDNFLDKYTEILQDYLFLDKRVAKDNYVINFLDFDWQLSSGQMALLNIFSKLLGVNPKQKFKINGSYDKIKSHIIILDEVDLYLHPEWSKKIIYLLTTVLPATFEKKVQIIISSHSPFIVSDLPKENIIFLDKYENDTIVNNFTQKEGNCKVIPEIDKKETFGANIHTLFTSSFFLEDGLIGEFAKGKINEILEFYAKVKIQEKSIKENEAHNYEDLINKYDNAMQNQFKYTQSIIGDEYLANVIENHIIEIEKILLGKDKAKENKINRLQNEIDKLNSKL